MKGRVGILGGTSEGRLLCEYCSQRGIPAAVSVATAYGQSLLPGGNNLEVHSGRMNREELLAWIQEKELSAVIDGTHPFAAEISENARWACGQANIPWIRLVRESEEKTEDSVIWAEDMEEGVDRLKMLLDRGAGERAFVTTGSKDLGLFKKIPDYQEKLYVRVLPSLESLKACQEAGIKQSHVIAMQGPFSYALNRAMLENISATCIITKESGKRGGFSEKVRSGLDAGCQVVAVGRPSQEQGKSLEEVKAWLDEQWGNNETKREVSLIGMGSGNLDQITWEGLMALCRCDALLGAKRMVESSLSMCREAEKSLSAKDPLWVSAEKKQICVTYQPEEMLSWLKDRPSIRRPALVYSGDTGFYSGAAGFLLAARKEAQLQCRLIPGISSIQMMAAKVGRPWDKAHQASLHGRQIPGGLDWSMSDGRDLFLLTAGTESIHGACRLLIQAGQHQARIAAGQRLGDKAESIIWGSPEEMQEKEFDSLSCLWIVPEGKEGDLPW